jgi:hypothetical protein
MAPGPSTRKQDAAQSKRKKTEVVTHVHNFLIANIFPDQAEVPSHQIDETISTFVDRISDDHRRCYRQGVLVKPPSPVKRQRQADAEAARRHNISATFTLSPNTRLDARYQMETERDADDEADTVPHPPKRKREPRVVQPSVGFFFLSQTGGRADLGAFRTRHWLVGARVATSISGPFCSVPATWMRILNVARTAKTRRDVPSFGVESALGMKCSVAIAAWRDTSTTHYIGSR